MCECTIIAAQTVKSQRTYIFNEINISCIDLKLIRPHKLVQVGTNRKYAKWLFLCTPVTPQRTYVNLNKIFKKGKYRWNSLGASIRLIKKKENNNNFVSILDTCMY